MLEADLLAILDVGPIDPAALAFVSKAQRRRAQAGIDALIDYLDAVTPDADLEPEDEDDPSDYEPNLGAPEHEMNYRWGWGGIVDRKCSQTSWAGGTLCDLELDLSDREPALGVPEGDHHHQGSWGRVNGSAFEDEADGWDADWENEEDQRDLPGHREGMAILAEQDRIARAA